MDSEQPSLLFSGERIVWQGKPGSGPGLMFLLIGLHFSFGRYIAVSYLKKRMTYLVTNKCVLVFKGGSSIQSLEIKRLPAPELSEKEMGQEQSADLL